ncbi:hypothetical protein BDR07DRAFT_1496116 [Suillus spraguei]|nr:hypothetical protein BDR07DRAFT_1496116 [Suillus spraguei]
MSSMQMPGVVLAQLGEVKSAILPEVPNRAIILPSPQHNSQMYGRYLGRGFMKQPVLSSPNYMLTFLKPSSCNSAPGQIVPAKYMVDDAVCVLYIFNGHPDSYYWRATHAQVDALTRFMGRKPHWWVDPYANKVLQMDHLIRGGTIAGLDKLDVAWVA